MENSSRPSPLGLAAHRHHDGIGKINLSTPPVRPHSQVVFADIFPKDPGDFFSSPGLGKPLAAVIAGQARLLKNKNPVDLSRNLIEKIYYTWQTGCVKLGHGQCQHGGVEI